MLFSYQKRVASFKKKNYYEKFYLKIFYDEEFHFWKDANVSMYGRYVYILSY